MDDVEHRLHNASSEAFEGEGIAFAYLFGSHARGDATPRSDVDVAVHTDGSSGAEADPFRLARRLEDASGLGSVEVVVLDDAPISLAGRVREEGRLIHRADEVARVRWESLTARRHHDFRIHEERSARERLAAMARGD